MSNAIDHEELNRRKGMLRDAYNFSAYIPDDLRTKLEETLDSDQRELVLQLQILAIQFGRKLQQAESSNNVKLEVIHTKQPQASNLVMGMIGNVTQNEKRPDIIIAPSGTFDKH